MSEMKFVDGLRAFKPHANAPSFVIAALEINTAELQTWLAQQGEKVRLDLKESRSGTYYCSVNEFVPKPQSQGYDPQKSGEATVPKNDFGPPPSDGFDDDIPF